METDLFSMAFFLAAPGFHSVSYSCDLSISHALHSYIYTHVNLQKDVSVFFEESLQM